MRIAHLLRSLLLPTALLPSLALADSSANYTTSSKRGLIYISDTPTSDADTWVTPYSDLTWYYNYSPLPSPIYTGNTSLQFVPMCFSTSTTFLDQITSLISSGTNITHILSFNEPDGSTSTGGSSISPEDAAETWQSQLAPLQAQGIKIGAPATTGSQQGSDWLTAFFAACSNCTADFLPLHWYGDFADLASWIGQANSTALSHNISSLWITEFAYPNQKLEATQDFFNQSVAYLDRLEYVERYSYFGSFRSDESNVGDNVAMLDKKGRLTDVGSWYLGGKETGNTPSEGVVVHVGAAWVALVVVGVCFVML